MCDIANVLTDYQELKNICTQKKKKRNRKNMEISDDSPGQNYLLSHQATFNVQEENTMLEHGAFEKIINV